MPRKANNAYCNPHVEIQWEVFLKNGRTVDALIHFIEGESNNQQLRAACGSDACRREVDRMRRLGNHESRERARKFLSRHYSW
jgi:hypothetical protein